MEFFLAPYPVNGTPAEGDSSKSPDVTTNSWGCPSSEGCSADTLQAAVEAQRAAGIMMVVAAGNGGPACTTVSDPPGIYEAAYSIGALTTGSDSAASFSSRGPVIADMSLRLKPDLSAPGTSTRSSTSTSTTSYGSLSGTSMATPHVAGAVALVLSAAPSLRGDVTGIETILNETAVPIASGTCDATNPLGTPPNNTYGYGRLDVKAAVDRALTLLRLTGAASRKTHSGSDYDIDLPLSGAPGVECRSGTVAQDYTIVLHFNNPVTTGSATVSAHNPSGAGNVSGSPMFSGNDMFVNLTGVTNQQVLTLTLSGVTDTSNQVLSSATVNIGFLVGDVNGSGRVDAADVSSVRQQTLQTITASNFRNDLNVSGRIDAADVSIARQQTLTSLP
jgi:subtilisin family serine protease